jgi:hypothetical protein
MHRFKWLEKDINVIGCGDDLIQLDDVQMSPRPDKAFDLVMTEVKVGQMWPS